MTKALNELHSRPFKVRLSEADADLLEALAAYHDVEPAVLARMMIKRALGRAVYALPRLARGKDGCRVT